MSRFPKSRYPLILVLASLSAGSLALAAEDLPPPPGSLDSGSQAPVLPSTETTSGGTDLAQPLAPPPVPEPDPSAITPSSDSPPAEATAPSPRGGNPDNAIVTRASDPTDNSTGRKMKDYASLKPQWALELAFSPNALGGNDIAPIQSGIPTRGISFAAEFQPAILQDFGVFGFGPSIGLYPMIGTLISTSATIDSTSPTPSNFSNWKIGFQVRYQAKFFREQLIVPTVAFMAESVTYGFNDGSQGRLTALGPSFGAWLLLNSLDRASANDFYFEQGVSRSYFTADLRLLSGSDPVVNFSGASLFFGLRIEL